MQNFDMAAKKRKQYSDKDKASALAVLDANNGNLSATAKLTGVPRKTLADWAKGRVVPEVAELRHEKKEELADVFERVAYKYLARAEKDDVIDNTTGNSAVTTAAVAVDKMRLLRGLPTEIVQLVPALVDALERAGMNPQEMFERMIQKANERAQLRNQE